MAKATMRAEGTIKKVVVDRGFGFITGDEGGDYFFHQQDLQNIDIRGIQPGDRVSFAPISTPKGARANEVTKIR